MMAWMFYSLLSLEVGRSVFEKVKGRVEGLGLKVETALGDGDGKVLESVGRDDLTSLLRVMNWRKRNLVLTPLGVGPYLLQRG
jgi:hypothetical protein